MAETLGSYRLLEEQPTGGSGEQVKNDSSSKKSEGLPEGSSSSKTYPGGLGTRTKDDSSTAIKQESNATSLELDVSKSARKTVIHTDLYSEDLIGSYDHLDIDAEYAEMVARLGIAYAKMTGGEASDALVQTADMLGKYARTRPIDESKMNALAKGLLYRSLKEVVSNAASQNGSNGNNNIGSSGSSNGGYNSVNNDGTNNPSSAAHTEMNEATSGSKVSTVDSPYANLLDTIDDLVNDLQEPTDYAEVSDDFVPENPNTEPSYESIGSVDMKSSGVSYWDLRAMPDAMSNMFDVYFRICETGSDDFDGKQLKPGVPSIDDLFASTLLSARIKNIEIPSYERATTSVTAFGGTIERPTGVINTPGQSSFSIRGDSRLIYVDVFNTLSGTPMSDFMGAGSAIAQLRDNFVLNKVLDSSTAEELKKDNEKLSDKLKAIEEFRDEEYNAARSEAVEVYKSSLSEDQKNALNDLQAQAEKDGTDFLSQWQEYIEKNADTEIAALKKEKNALKEASKKASTWADKEKYYQKITEVDAIITKHKEALNKMQEAERAAAKKIASLKAAAIKQQVRKVVNGALGRNSTGGLLLAAKSDEEISTVTGLITRNIAPKAVGTAGPEDLEKALQHKRVDIIVKRTSPGKRFRSKLSAKKDERFVFEDVKLLGCSTPIKFERESANTADFTYNFIYKRFYKIDYYADDADAWVQSQLDDMVSTLTNTALRSL